MKETWAYCRFCGHTLTRLAVATADKKATCPGRRPGFGACTAPVVEYVERGAPPAPAQPAGDRGGADDGDAGSR